jgi:hypothetical protein
LHTETPEYGARDCVAGEAPQDEQIASQHAAVIRLEAVLERAQRLLTQQPKVKAILYAMHAPEVECSGKGKPKQSYEFDLKTSIWVTRY